MNTYSMDTAEYNIRLSDIADEPKELLLPIEGYEKMPLVKLEEAVLPIIDIFPKIQQNVHIAKYNCQDRGGTLELDMAAAIALYTMGTSSSETPFYHALNSILRSNQTDRSDKLQHWFSYLKLFITALSHIPSYRGTIYRGVKLDLSEYYKQGKEFIWWAFSSCTKSLGVLQANSFLGQQGAATLFIIECFSGKQIYQYSHYKHEDEVLLVAARKFVVVDRLNPRPQLWIIHIKEIESPFPFLAMESSISSTLEIVSPPVNVCSQDPKPSTNDFATSTDDLLSNSEQEMETVISDCTTKLEVIALTASDLDTDDNQNSLPPSASVEPTLTLVALHHRSNQQNILATFLADLPNMDNTTNSNKVVTGEPITKHTTEKTIRLLHQQITEESAKTIAETIRRNTTLETLRLKSNKLKDDTLYHIIPALIGRSSLSIFINDNKITDIGVKYIADMLFTTSNTIFMLHLDKNLITNQGVKSIVQAILSSSNSSLTTLSLAGNSLIDDECIDSIIELINKNRTLTSIHLEECNLSKDGQKRLQTAATNRKNIYLYT